MGDDRIVKDLLVIAKRLVSVKHPVNVALEAANSIIDGIDGWVSETGEFPENFWNKNVSRDYDRLVERANKMSRSPVETGKMVRLLKDIKSLIVDLVIGMEGVISEQGEIPSRYWKSNVLREAVKAIKVVNSAIREMGTKRRIDQ